ncbi:MAG: hypothetical protein ACXQS3_00010 [Candidatus Methanofastidiosia archaeon]
MNEKKAVGILLIILFIFIYIFRNMQSMVSENVLDLFIIGFFLILIFLWQFISPNQEKKEIKKEEQ